MHPKIEEIILRTRRQLLLNRRAEQPSRFAGEGLDFRELRPYSAEDDIRHLNWKSMARTREPAVNVFNENRQISVGLLYLNSGGLAIGTPRSKRETAVEILTALSYAGLQSGDRVSALFFDETLRGWHPPTRQRMIVDRNYMLASELDPLGRSVDYAALTRELSSRLRKRSVLFLIGDFMEMPDLTALSALHEVNCLIVRDPLDEELPSGEFMAVDAGTLAQRELTIDAATRRRYRRIVREHDSRLSEDFRRQGIRWQRIMTGDDAIEKLIRFARQP